MSQRHLIDEAVFELAQRTRGAVLDDAAMQALVCERLLPVVDELLTRYDEADCVIALQNVDIDLGEIEYAQLESELPRRLEAALSAELATRIKAISGVAHAATAEPGDRRIARAGREREWLEAFLFGGHLPERASGTPREWLRGLDVPEAKALAVAIALSPHRAFALERFVLQFDADTLLLFLRAIAPVHAEAYASSKPRVAALAYAEMAQRAWLRCVIEAALQGEKLPPIENWIEQWRRTEPETADEAARQELAQLDAALGAADAGALRPLWVRWATVRRALLRERLLAHRAHHAAQWVAKFNESLLREILNLLSIPRAAFIGPLLDQPGLFLLGRPHARESREAYGKRILQAVFEQDPEPEFDEAQASLLLGRLLSLGETQQAFERATGYILTWRRALKRTNHVAGYRALDRWLSSHGRSAPLSSNRATTLMGFSAQTGRLPEPRFESQLESQFESEPPPLAPFAPVLPASEVQLRETQQRESSLLARIEAFAGDESRFEPLFRADFLRSIEQHLPEAAQRADYYEAIWAALEAMKPIDLESIAAELSDTPKSAPPVPPAVLLPEPSEASLRQALAFRLHGMRDLEPADATRLATWIEESCADASAEARRIWSEVFASSLAAARVAQAVPVPQLEALLVLLRPADHARIRSIAAAVRQVFRRMLAGNNEIMAERSEQWAWRFVLHHFHGSAHEANTVFVEALALYLLQQSAHAPNAAFRSTIDTIAKQLGQASGQGEVHFEPQIAAAAPAEKAAAQKPRGDAPEPGVLEEVRVWNAGLVLASPYLPRLFGLLKLMDKNAFVDEAAAERAVHLLEFLVSGESRTPEHRLVLNKQLCGLRTGRPLQAGIDIRSEEKEIIEQLLAGMIAHWKVLGHTTIAGLRQSFLQRQGTLRLKDEAWHLHVQGMAYDMLLDQLPWSYKLIKHPWMTRPIHVSWR